MRVSRATFVFVGNGSEGQGTGSLAC